MQSYHRVLEILSILQTIAPISYNEDSTFAFNKLYKGSYIGRSAERSKALVLGTSHFGGASSNLAPLNIAHRRQHCTTIKQHLVILKQFQILH